MALTMALTLLSQKCEALENRKQFFTLQMLHPTSVLTPTVLVLNYLRKLVNILICIN